MLFALKLWDIDIVLKNLESEITEYEVLEILCRKVSRKIPEKLGGQFFARRDQQPVGEHQQATRGQNRYLHAARFLGRVGYPIFGHKWMLGPIQCSSAPFRPKTNPSSSPPFFPCSVSPSILDLHIWGRFFKSVWWNHSLVCNSFTHPITFCSHALCMKYFAALGVTYYV